MQTQKKLTAGRSMVEMLGVLAIIGVLSIGGIMGFRRAMDTKRANDILHDVSILGTSAATRNQLYENEPCSTFEESNFTIPDVFKTCILTINADGFVTVNVEYVDGVSKQVINILANRCTNAMYVSADATQFIVGNHNKDCSLREDDQNDNNETGEPEDPQDWECTTDADCDEWWNQGCVDHRCRFCEDYDKVSDLSEYCCSHGRAEALGNIIWKDGVCQYNEEVLCDDYSFVNGCFCHHKVGYYTEQSVSNYIYNPFAWYCCPENESLQSCCAHVGGYWCEGKNACVRSSSLCERFCDINAYYEEDNGQSDCACYWYNMYEGSGNGYNYVGHFCCDPNSGMELDCCEAAGGKWNSYENGCWLVPEDKTCITMQRAWLYKGSVNTYPEVVCCDEANMSEPDCCVALGYTWCASQKLCIEDGEYCDNAFCNAYTRSYGCKCSALKIHVSSDGADDQPYCCSKNDTSLKACCQSLGFTWKGKDSNTGTCSAPEPDVCITYVDDEMVDGSRGRVVTQTLRVCCDGEGLNEEDCCASMNGYWCAQNSTCYKTTSVNNGGIDSSPCMTPEICEGRSGYLWCLADNKCYPKRGAIMNGTWEVLLRTYYDLCADVDETICQQAKNNWCVADQKCYPYIHEYLEYCADVTQTICSNKRGRWCSKNNKCYYYDNVYVSKCN